MKIINAKLQRLMALSAAALVLTACSDDPAPAPEADEESIAALTENADVFEGFFTAYRDPESGSVHLLINEDQLSDEFIYTAQTANGVVEAGQFTGAYVGNSVLTAERYYNRIEFVAQNTSFYFDPDNALSRAADANISDAILAVAEIVAEDEETGDILVNIDGLLMSESLQQVSSSDNPVTGGLDGDKSKVLSIRSYPENTDFEVEYVYSGGEPSWSEDITDSRAISIRMLHSFIAMPDNDFTPRFADSRVGTFDTQVTDLTSTSSTPYRDLVHRWDLVKQDPAADISDPVEPIVWWIENTTPVEWRDLIMAAGLEWNKSFEKAGFSNAVEIKVQPDDADWDAGDIRYNVLRWTSSPTPPFGGYGPSFVNPRTGQIIGADIMLEASFLNRRRIISRWLAEGMNTPEDLAKNLDQLAGHTCSLGNHMQSANLSAFAFADFAATDGMSAAEMTEQIVHDSMHYLILHEMGHTLGMNHNMKATQYLTPEESFDLEVVNEKGLAASVMDYPSVNFAPRGSEQTRFYAVTPGPYDDWFIKFSYSPELNDPAAMAEHLAKSTSDDLIFGNDADDMRAPGWGIDPRVNIYDMSNDAIKYSDMRMELVRDVLDNMSPADVNDGESYDDLVVAIEAMMGEWRWAGNVTSRYVGGVYVDRALRGQDGATQPYEPVAESRQREAMALLAKYHFAPDAMEMNPEVIAHAQRMRRGFNNFGAPEDPKLHGAILGGQSGLLDHLLHPGVLQRLVDTTLYGNTYTIDAMMDELNAAVFAADKSGNINTMRQNLQVEYVNRLVEIAKNEEGAFPTQAVSMAVLQLHELKEHFATNRSVNRSTKAHSINLVSLIERGLHA
ncbi:zinc-dependent metalloprotease [uncultured Umboniibacter sp.]|uniref:zinc-dependent metalloprotease n=1 Tax=uncultured Umboniibacter sp. TaxID=1798917 RepID=UPI0026346204|nr:zinc-dependent metalloprotease [uncultured Umboniibacter sp.]